MAFLPEYVYSPYLVPYADQGYIMASVVQSIVDSTILYTAVQTRNSTATIVLLRDLNLNPNIVDNFNRTPLLYACMRGYVEIVKSLLMAGANPNCVDDIGDTPLSVAIKCMEDETTCFEIVEALIQSGADPNLNPSGGLTPLMQSVLCGNHHIISQLVEAGADTNARYTTDTPCMIPANASALSIAANLTHDPEIIQILFRKAHAPTTVFHALCKADASMKPVIQDLYKK